MGFFTAMAGAFCWPARAAAGSPPVTAAALISAEALRKRRLDIRFLFGPVEEAHVDRLAQHVPLHRLHHVDARLERVGARRDVNPGIKREDFPGVVMRRAGGRRART